MDYKIYKNVFTDNNIEYVLNNINCEMYHEGRVGNRVNLKQKIRKDLFIGDIKLLQYIDNNFYDKIYNDINKNFSNIKYREQWKMGFYDYEKSGFYNLHTDTAGDTKYRVTSCVTMLSSVNDYEGGELHFPELKKQFKLDKGETIVFKSSLMHGVHPVTKGYRKVLISFFFDDEGMKIKKSFTKNINYERYKPYLTNLKLQYPTNYYKEGSEINNYNKGDIDYSDLHYNDKWSENDDYFFKDNDSDILLITFAGMGWKKSIPTFIFYNFLKPYSNVDILFLRDVKMRYYLTGLKNNTNNLQETIDFIKNLTTKKDYKKIVAVGCSAGGYAAILFGHLLKFDKVIAFSPQVVLNNKKVELIGDIYNAPRTCEWLTNKNQDDAFYQKCLDLKNFVPLDTEIDLHYAKMGSNGVDKKHALYLEGNNCKIIEHDSSNHMLALELRDNGKLKEIIDEAIGDAIGDAIVDIIL
tara:strand:- start:1476 stop:2876 length:1401 start_codon:yes stop_codon:yes gene_type:complete